MNTLDTQGWNNVGQLEGLEQASTSGFYRVDGKFLVCAVTYTTGYKIFQVVNNDGYFLGVAEKHDEAWTWRNALGDGTSSAHTSGERHAMRKINGHYSPPIDEPLWTHSPASSGMTPMMVTESERAAIMAFRSGVSNAVQD